MGIQLGSAYGKVELDANGVNRGVDSAIGSMQRLQQKMVVIGQTISDIGARMTLGLTLPLTLFAKSAIDSSNQSEEAITNLKATIESTGGVAGVTAEQALEMAAAFQKVTKFSDETIINGQAMLLTFTNIGKDVFPLAVEAMLNMGEKFGSVENASIQLGKALQDPISGVTALRRVGVMLTDEQEKQIKHFMEINDIASAQKIILNELGIEFGGLAEAMGKTDAGKLEQFKNAMDDLKELFGDRLKESLIPFIESMTKAINDFLALPEPVKNAIVDLVISIGKLVLIAGPILFIVGKLIVFASLFLPGGAMAGVGTFIASTLLPAFTTFFGFITATAIPAILAFAAANAWWIGPLLLVAATVYLVYLAFKNNFMGITTTVKQLWEIIKYYFNLIVKRIVDSFKNINWSTLGRNVVIGIANGLLGGIPAIVAAAGKAASAALKAFDNAFDFGSPSKVMEKRGMWSAMGYAIGWKKNINPNEMAKQMANPLLSQNSSSQQQNINVHLANGVTMRQAESMIAQNNQLLLKRLDRALGGA
jgi:hypothetical protein